MEGENVTSSLQVHYHQTTVQDLIARQDSGSLNLEPGFQRKSVWNKRDRSLLIHSMLQGYPMPSIFLYRREDNGWPRYDVIDGKQRLESIFMFAKVKPFARQGYDVRFQFEGDEDAYTYDWRELQKHNLQGKLLGYRIQTVEVSGDLSDIVDLFVRINSTGKALTTAEKRSARFYKNPILKEARGLASRNGEYLARTNIVNASARTRMRDVELMSELLASVLEGGPIHKKQSIDRVIGNDSVHAASLKKASQEVTRTMGHVKRMFPHLQSTRFHNRSEFYTLFMVVWQLMRQRKILTDKASNRQAMQVLERLSDGVDSVREQQRAAKGARRGQQLYVDYLMTVQQGTDALSNRKQRQSIIQDLLEGLFESKDAKRIFSAAQRRLLWNSDERKRCSQCEEPLDWTNFQVDHVKPHSKGGRTALENAALICAICNPSKGARKRARKKPSRRRAA